MYIPVLFVCRQQALSVLCSTALCNAALILEEMILFFQVQSTRMHAYRQLIIALYKLAYDDNKINN